MQTMYKSVQTQQKTMTERNQANRMKRARDVVYKEKDLVLLWEPAQIRKFTTADKDADDKMQQTRKAPKKWTPTWSGPHYIVDIVPAGPQGGQRYIIKHLQRGLLEMHPNKLHLFNPWSNQQPSTAPDMADGVPYQVGNNAHKGALFIIALQHPWTFGLGQVMKTEEDGRIKFRWYGGKGKAPTGQYMKGWMGPRKTPYYADEPRRPSDLPYYEIDMHVHQADIECHSFSLTSTNRIPTAVLDFMRASPDIQWQ
jgi:hypothetical protein